MYLIFFFLSLTLSLTLVFSKTSWLVWMLSSAISIFYAVIQYQVTGKGTALIFSSIIVFIFVFVTICLIALYRKDDRSKA